MNPVKWLFNVISKTALWVWFSKRILSKWTLRFMGYPESALPKYSEIGKVLSTRQPLDVFAFTSCDRATPVAKLIKLITGDRFSHAGIILNATTVYDSRSDGVRFRNLLAMIGQSDDFAISKFTFKSIEHRKEYERDIERYCGRPYDFTQELGGKSLYCSELVYVLLQGRVEQPLETRFFHGQRGFSPGDVYNSGEVVFDHNP
jgi:hypothetical protein